MSTTHYAGMTWGWVGDSADWNSSLAEDSMKRLVELGGNWITIAFQGVQATAQSTVVSFGEAPQVSDADVRTAIQRTHQLGQSVCLKPVVNVADGTWRAHIGFFDADVPGEPTWTQWFESYTRFIVHYAKIAEEEGCELFCIGCEMVRADSHEAEWRELIAQVRESFHGAITYNCDKYQEDRLTWWDAVDVISSSGYYPSGSWTSQLDRIEAVVRAHDKPFLFMEAGCPSRAGSPSLPNDWNLQGAVSLEAQDAYYEEMFAETSRRPWFAGFMLWDWPARLYPREEAAANDDYCIYGKPAEARVAAHYRSMAVGVQ